MHACVRACDDIIISTARRSLAGTVYSIVVTNLLTCIPGSCRRLWACHHRGTAPELLFDRRRCADLRCTAVALVTHHKSACTPGRGHLLLLHDMAQHHTTNHAKKCQGRGRRKRPVPANKAIPVVKNLDDLKKIDVGQRVKKKRHAESMETVDDDEGPSHAADDKHVRVSSISISLVLRRLHCCCHLSAVHC